jgi:hypothetical protein
MSHPLQFFIIIILASCLEQDNHLLACEWQLVKICFCVVAEISETALNFRYE